MIAVREVIDGGWYILGIRLSEFETAMARSVGAPYAVGVASGTDALTLAVQAAGLKTGDEVITVSHTAGPTAAAILAAGCIPVLVDVAPETYCLDPAKLDMARTGRTRAVLPVHLYGHPADMDPILAFAKRHGLAVIEDCAQAQGARYRDRIVGTMGDANGFSFYPTKNLGALGDAGAVTCSDPALHERLRQLRLYGWRTPQLAEFPGGRCSRLDELQAAILLVKLRHLAESLAERRRLAARYDAALADLPVVPPAVAEGCIHAYNIYVIQADDRDALAETLRLHDVLPGRHYPYAIHQQPGFAAARVPESLAVTESLMKRILSLPLFPGLEEIEQERVIRAIRGHYGR
jgi:dTDP-4-amino-4,6-dideoxygalactose transaminase